MVRHDGPLLDDGTTPVASGHMGPLAGGRGLVALAPDDGDRLRAHGYVEDEHLYSTSARVLDDSEGALRVLATDIPTTTRVLVRRPADAAAFSGVAVIELLDAADGYDVAEIWGACAAEIVEAGHAWIGMTAGPVAADALVHADPERYAPLTWAREPGVAPATIHATQDGYRSAVVLDGAEEGLVWDLLAALAQTLRGDAAVLGRTATTVLAVGHGMAGVQLNSFANALHEVYSGAVGHEILDGYLNVGGGGIRRTLRQDSTMPGIASWRPARPPRLSVPHLTVSSEADHVLFGSALLAKRTDLGPMVRHVQVAGAPHRDLAGSHRPPVEDVARAGRVVPQAGPDVSVVPLGTVVEAMFGALVRWAVDGEPAPASRWLSLDENGSVLRDDIGNALGGVRTGLADMPVAAVVGASAQHLQGSTRPFTRETFDERYGGRADFFTWFDIIEGVCLTEGYLTPRGTRRHRAVAARLLDDIGVPAES